MRVMAAPRKYPDELRERATRMAVEARRDPATRPGALARIGKQLGINPETLRNWVTQAEIDGGVRPGTTTDDAARIAEWSGRTGSCAGRTRSSRPRRRFSLRRSSTAE
jgi:transposase